MHDIRGRYLMYLTIERGNTPLHIKFPHWLSSNLLLNLYSPLSFFLQILSCHSPGTSRPTRPSPNRRWRRSKACWCARGCTRRGWSRRGMGTRRTTPDTGTLPASPSSVDLPTRVRTYTRPYSTSWRQKTALCS